MKNLISQKGMTAKEVCGRMAKYKSGIDKDTVNILGGMRTELKRMGIPDGRSATDEILENFSELLCRTIQKDPTTKDTIRAVVADLIKSKIPISYTETFVFGFKDMLVPYLQKEFSDQYYSFFSAQKIIDAALRRIWVTTIDEYYRQTTRSTEEKEERWRSLVENAPDIIMMVGHDGTIKFINRTVSSFSVEKTIGTGVYDYTPPKYHKTLKSSIERVFRTGRPTSYESAGDGPDGSISWYSTTVGPIKNSGKVTDVILISRDVTGQKRAEEKIKESEEKYRNLVENIPDVSWKTDENGKTIFISRNVKEMYGYSPEEIYKKGDSVWFRRIHPADIKKLKDAYGLLFKKAQKFDIEYRIKRKDGEWIWLHDKATSIYTENNISYAIGLFRDITERKKAEDAIKESEEKFRSIVESSIDAIMTLEPPSWKFTSGNPATVKMFNTKDEKTFISLGPWEVSPKCQPDGQLSAVKAKKMIMKAMKEGSNFFEWTHKRLNGNDFPATVLLTRVKLSDRTFLQATVRDMTDKKKIEEERRESEEKFKAVFDNANDGILVADITTKKFVMANRKICNMLGYTENELKRLGVMGIHPKEDLPTVLKAFKLQAQKKIGIARYLPMLRKDKRIFYADISSAPFVMNGKPYLIGFFRESAK